MTSSIPKATKQWNIIAENGATSLTYGEEPIAELGDDEVLVKRCIFECRFITRPSPIDDVLTAVEYRDLVVKQGAYPFSFKPPVVPGSDGAGTVLAIGKHVSRFKPGDKVITMLNPHHLAGSVERSTSTVGLGASVDGTFRTVGAFSEQGLSLMPEGLTFAEASTLTCAGLTAWNALFGLAGKEVTAGQWVLTQGTGGVSIFALQFAKATGARVIATTSSSSGEKAELLKKLGADHVISYVETPDWGAVAKQLTGGVGVDLVVEVAGTAMQQSVDSLKLDGTISVVGSIGGTPTNVPTLINCWMSLFTARGLWVGSRQQMEAMCRAIEANKERLRPVVSKVFKFDQLREAYEYLEAGKYYGKVAITID